MMQNDPEQKNFFPFEELKQKVRDGLNVRSHSGQVQTGDVFVAVPGGALPGTVDGAKFIPDALEQGADYVVACNGWAKLHELNVDNKPVHYVNHEDPAAALGELAGVHFGTDTEQIPLIGVTGTNGKTTITYILEHVLNATGRKTGVLGTVSYRWPGYFENAALTTPGCWKVHESLSGMRDSGCDVGVMEVSSHAIAQQRVAGVQFQVAILTNLTQDHLDYHGDMASYFEAKARLFRVLPAPGKVNVINWDDSYGRKLYDELDNVIGYGLTKNPVSSKADSALEGRVLESSINGLKMEMTYKGQTWELQSMLVGGFNAYNLLAAQAACLAIGMTPDELQALSTFAGVPGRLERVPNPHGRMVFVDYAHTPDALENVLQTLKELDFNRLITVFGCGGNRDRTKRPLMGEAVCRYSDIAVLTSDNPRNEDPIAILNDIRPGLRGCTKVLETADRRTAIDAAIGEMVTGDVLLIAGKGHEDYQQIGDKKLPFSDQEVVREILK